MKSLKVLFILTPLVAVFTSLFCTDIFSYTAIWWFGLGIIATLSFYGICWTNNDLDLGDMFFGILIIPLGMFSALMVGVIGLASLGDPQKRAEYIIDQVIREARSGIFD